MKTTFIAAMAALMLVVPTLSQAQGNITVTPLSSNQFNAYLTLGVVGEVNNSGVVGFLPTPSGGYDGSSATSTSVSFTNGNGVAGISASVLAASVGLTVGQGASSTTPLTGPVTGLVIGLYNPTWSQNTSSGYSPNINGQLSTSLSTVSQSFDAYYYSFQNPVSQLNVNGNLLSSGGSASQLYFIPIVQPVPEPQTMALAALGGASLLLFRRKRA